MIAANNVFILTKFGEQTKNKHTNVVSQCENNSKMYQHNQLKISKTHNDKYKNVANENDFVANCDFEKDDNNFVYSWMCMQYIFYTLSTMCKSGKIWSE